MASLRRAARLLLGGACLLAGAASSLAQGSRLTLLSVRARTGPGNDALVCGAVTAQPAPVLFRGLGPSLASSLPAALLDPVGELRGGGALLARNDDWRETQEAAIAATNLMPYDNREPAILGTYPAGGCAFQVGGKGGAGGYVLGEFYDLAPAASPATARALFAKARVQPADGEALLYFTVSGPVPKRVLIRALGPELADRGYAGFLANPTLQLFSGTGSSFASNDDWNTPANPDIAATGLAPGDARSSALLLMLAPGSYTALARGVGSSSGLVFVDITDLDSPAPYPDPLAELPPPLSRLTSFPAWQAATFSPAERSDPAISGAAADAEGDGLGNLLEYAFGTDPRGADGAAAAPVAALAGGYATLSFLRLPSRADLSYRVEVSGELGQGAWTEIARSDAGAATAASPGQNPSSIGEVAAGDATRVTVGDIVPAGPGAPRRFLRLRVVRP